MNWDVIAESLIVIGASFAVGLAIFWLVTRADVPIGIRLGQINRRRVMLERRRDLLSPRSIGWLELSEAILRLEAKEDRLLARHLARDKEGP